MKIRKSFKWIFQEMDEKARRITQYSWPPLSKNARQYTQTTLMGHITSTMHWEGWLCVCDSWKAMLIVTVSMIMVDTTPPFFLRNEWENKTPLETKIHLGLAKWQRFNVNTNSFLFPLKCYQNLWFNRTNTLILNWNKKQIICWIL